MLFRFHREEQLHAVVQVTGHPVGAAHEELLVAVVGEPEDTAVLQLPPHNTAHGNIVADAFQTGAQGADAPDDQFNLHARHGRFIQFLNDRLVQQGVHLGNDVTFPAFFHDADLIIHQFIDFFPQPDGRHYQLVPDRRLGVTGKQIEKCGGVAAELVVGRHQAHVGVQLGRAVVVVAGAQMHVAFDAVGFLPHNQNDLRMGLQSYQAIDNMGAGFFQTAGPEDVVLFIEAGFQFYQYRDLLAVFRSPGQRRHNGRIAADAVQGLLDGQHLGVVGRIADKLHHRIEAFVGMEQQNIFFFQTVKQIVVLRQIFRALGYKGFVEPGPHLIQ